MERVGWVKYTVVQIEFIVDLLGQVSLLMLNTTPATPAQVQASADCRLVPGPAAPELNTFQYFIFRQLQMSTSRFLLIAVSY